MKNSSADHDTGLLVARRAVAIAAGLILTLGIQSLRLPAGLSGSRVEAAEKKAHTEWNAYEGGADSAQFSALTKINKSNVAQLQQTWFYPSSGNGANFGFNPVVVRGVMYIVGKGNAIVALNAATGKEIWVHALRPGHAGGIYRGISYWESKDRRDRRLFYCAGNRLYAIDAGTGETIPSFGEDGSIDLRVGLGRDPETIRQIQSGTPGRVFENLIIEGSSTGEEYDSPPGDIRAYDVRTGKMLWIFHTVPHPGEFGYDTWPKDAWKYIGGNNDWSGITIDEKRGIAYFPLGSPTYDFYGGDRIGAGLFGNCLLALDARTGKYLWHFQTVHHDLWDYDLPTAPKLLTVKHDGKKVDVVAVTGKNGFVYVFDRVTGKPLWPIEERPVPRSTVPGEVSWPTQPFPSAPPPFTAQSFTADDIDPYIADPEERKKLADQVRSAVNDGIYTPPSTRLTIEMPGDTGGANWGTAAADSAAGFLYVQSKNAFAFKELQPKPPAREVGGPPAVRGHVLYIQNCQMCHQANLQGQPPEVPPLAGAIERIGAERVRSAVTKGRPPMPAFSDLTPRDVDSLVAFLTDPAAGALNAHQQAILEAPAPAAPKPIASNGAPVVRYWTGYQSPNSSEGLPANRPPWSTLTAYDLNKGTIAWQVPLGGVMALEEKGINNTGSFWPRGGMAVTAGGLIFSGTRSDDKVRAYDKDTGKVLWEKTLPASPDGIPAVYETRGREYVVFTAKPDPSVRQIGVSQIPVRRSGPPQESPSVQNSQGYYVFALPEISH